jgi:O-antigen/teichoic acid export membrane protein
MTLPDSTSLYQKFTKDVIIVGIAQLILQLRGVILFPFIAKILGAADYGIWVQAVITISLLAGFCGVGSFAFIRFFAGETDKEKIRQGFFSLLITIFSWSSLAALALFLLAAPVAKSLFGGKEATNIVQLSALILPFFSVNYLFLFFFRAFRKMNLFAFLMLAQGFGEVALAVGLIFAGWGIFGAIVAILFTHVLTQLAMLSMIVKQIGLTLPSRASFAKMKDYLRFDLPFVPSNFAWWIANTSDRYIIAIFLGVASTGVYSAAYSLGSIVTVYMSPLNMVLVPTLAYLYDSNRVEDVKIHLSYSLKYFLLLAIPSAAGLCLLAKPILQILGTPEFASGGSIVVPFVVAAMLLHGCQGIVMQPISLVKRTGIVGIAWAIAAALNLGLNLVLVPRFGIIAAAITTLVSFAVAIGITCYAAFKYLKFDIDWVFILKSSLATGVMCGVVLLFNPAGLLDLLVVVAVGAIVYFLAIYVMRGIGSREILFFRRLVASSSPVAKNKVAGGSNPKEDQY